MARMDFGGNYLLEAPRLVVWEGLNDTAILKASIPGCRSIEWVSETDLEVQVQVNLGLLKPVFTGDLGLSGIVPAERYTLWGRGRGGLLGLAEGSADIVLRDLPEGTGLVFAASGSASSEIMALGATLIGARAQQIIDGFFDRFAGAMGVRVRPLRED